MRVVAVVGLGLAWIAAGGEEGTPPGAAGQPQAGAVASAVTSRGSCPSWYSDEVFRFGLEVACGFVPKVEFENPGTPPEVIKRRVVFQGPTHGQVIVDVWENARGLGLDEWLAVYGDFARYPGAREKCRCKVGRKALDGVRETHPGDKAPPKDYLLVAGGALVVRVLYVNTDGGASAAAYQRMIETFEL